MCAGAERFLKYAGDAVYFASTTGVKRQKHLHSEKHRDGANQTGRNAISADDHLAIVTERNSAMEQQDRMVEDGAKGDVYECPFQKKDCNDYCGVFDKAHNRCSLLTIAEAHMDIAIGLKDMMEQKKTNAQTRW